MPTGCRRRPRERSCARACRAGVLWRIWPEPGRREVIADTGGGRQRRRARPPTAASSSPRTAASTSRSSRSSPTSRRRAYVQVGAAARRARRPRQLPDARLDCRCPTTWCVAPDGTVYFTDPEVGPPPIRRAAACFALDPDGTLRVVADGSLGTATASCSTPTTRRSIVVENGRDGEHHGFVRLRADGTREPFAPGSDGRRRARSTSTAGSTWPAAATSSRIYEPDGTVVEQLTSPGDHPVSTHCCFGGDDLRTLFAVDARRARPRVLLDRPADAGAGAPAWPGAGV